MRHVRAVLASKHVTMFLAFLALSAPSGAYFFSRYDASQALTRLGTELDGARSDLAIERQKNVERDRRGDCILQLQADYFEADSAWSVAFSNLVVGLSVRGDIPTLIAQLDTATADKHTAFQAYDQQISCPK